MPGGSQEVLVITSGQIITDPVEMMKSERDIFKPLLGKGVNLNGL